MSINTQDTVANRWYSPNELLYRTLPEQGFNLCPAKPGDAGLDFPVRIRNIEDPSFKVGVKPGPRNRLRLWLWNRLYANCIDRINGKVFIPPRSYASFPSGIYVKLPDDAWGSIKTRSSTAWKRSLEVFEAVIDSGYTGQLGCLVYNPHDCGVWVTDGERLAQLVVCPKYQLRAISLVPTLPQTARGETGFGSTGQ